MTWHLVAAGFAWDEYPGLRIGRLYSGQGDLGRHPVGETHAVRAPDATTTICGRPRAGFPHVFATTVATDGAALCDACGAAAV